MGTVIMRLQLPDTQNDIPTNQRNTAEGVR